MLQRKCYLILAVSCLFLSVYGKATPITLLDSQVLIYSPGNVLTELNPEFATDGNLLTGYFVETARNPQTPTQGLGGFEIRWDFDVSDFLTISNFTFNFSGILNDPSSFDSIQFRPIGATIQPSLNPNSFTELAMPDNTTVSTILSLTDSAVLPKNDVNQFVSGGILSIFTSTTFGFSSFQSISLQTLEVSADISGQRITAPDPNGVPEPRSFALLVLLLLGMLGVRHIRL